MKKNKMMRIASVLLVAVLLSTCAISGTFAKYITTATGSDEARVAKWGFTDQDGTLEISNFFLATYHDGKVNSTDGDVIAPGTNGSATIEFVYDDTVGTAPEVAYTIEVDVSESNCADSIQNNVAIQWRLDGGNWGSWNDLMTSLKGLSGDSSDGIYEYAAGRLPDGFADTHTIEWQWAFEVETNDANDTAMGNVAAADLADVTLKIKITATQITVEDNAENEAPAGDDAQG